MNKKGFLAMAPVDLWSMILLVVVLIAFAFLFTVSGIFSGRSDELLQRTMDMESEMLLYTMLRYDVDGKSLAEYTIENMDDYNVVEAKLKEVLDKACNPVDYCYANVEFLRKGETRVVKGISSVSSFRNSGKAEFLLPGKDERVVIRIVRYYGPEGAVGK